ncbi:MAG TPA: ABC transporter, partial [Bacteroidia bacterium]|nr:ABC transporter [Bacteroidia bacterium]
MALFVAVGNSILDIKGMWGDYWLVLFSVCCFANLLGLNISASFNSAVTIYILIPFLIIPQLLLSGIVVKFDKLNPAFASQTEVPFVGQAMASRWAYEALSVDQYKSNEYEKKFYIYDKYKSVANFRKNEWLTAMRNALGDVQGNLNNPQMQQKVSDNLLLLKNEIGKELILQPDMKYPYLDSLDPKHFSPGIAAKTVNYFNQLNDLYVQQYNNIDNKENALIESLTSTPAAKADFDKLKDDYQNENLESFVKNGNDFTRIAEIDHELIQRADPIFLDPVKSSIFGNAQFYAPNKRMFGQLFDTFWVNLGIVWFMTLTLAITLYFDALKSLLHFFSKIKLPAIGKRRAKS